MIQVVLQGPVLGSLSFNIYLSDLLFTVKEIGVCSFLDDTTALSVIKVMRGFKRVRGKY